MISQPVEAARANLRFFEKFFQNKPALEIKGCATLGQVFEPLQMEFSQHSSFFGEFHHINQQFPGACPSPFPHNF
jgi:hypothetical protein